jgi:hypothetical protein
MLVRLRVSVNDVKITKEDRLVPEVVSYPAAMSVLTCEVTSSSVIVNPELAVSALTASQMRFHGNREEGITHPTIP